MQGAKLINQQSTKIVVDTLQLLVMGVPTNIILKYILGQ